MTDFRQATRATFTPRYGGVDTSQWELQLFVGDRSISSTIVARLLTAEWRLWAEKALSSVGSFPSTWLLMRDGGWEARLSPIRP
jgi:hypothetical protein